VVTSSGTSKVGTAVGTGVDGVAVIRLTGVPTKARPPFSCGLLVGVTVGAGVSVGAGVGVRVSVGVALGPGVGVSVIVAIGVKVAGSDTLVLEGVGVAGSVGPAAATPARPETAPTSWPGPLLHAWRKANMLASKARATRRRHIVPLATIVHRLYHQIRLLFPGTLELYRRTVVPDSSASRHYSVLRSDCVMYKRALICY
jgi:hypothetical protein